MAAGIYHCPQKPTKPGVAPTVELNEIRRTMAERKGD
jgi:hypothetical protein